MPRLRTAVLLILLVLTMLAVGGRPTRAEGMGPEEREKGTWSVDGSGLGERVDLTRSWLFQVGDDPGYAAAAYDDSGWKKIETDRELSRYGFRGFRVCWYRVHVRVRPGVERLALTVKGVSGRYDIFANGVRIGGSGKMTMPLEQGVRGHTSLAEYDVPAEALAGADGMVVVAIRYAVAPLGPRGRGTNTPMLEVGGAGVFLETQDASRRDASFELAHAAAGPLALGGLSLLVGLVSLALYVALRKQQEYLAAAVNLLTVVATEGILIWGYIHLFSFQMGVLNSVVAGIGNLAMIEFVRLVLRRPLRRRVFVLEVASFVGPMMEPLAGILPVYVAFPIYFVPILVVGVLLPVLLVRAWPRGSADARLLLPAILMLSASSYYEFFQWMIYFAGLAGVPRQPMLHLESYDVDLASLGLFAFLITVLLLLVLRTVRVARERATVAAEIEAARTMQRLLLARASHATPGFDVESVYLPASEVGGDFFLVTPGRDGSLTAIVGDVAGKGLPAAMRVSMILGVLRRDEPDEPATMLRGLNEALLAEGDAGFTTACCVRMERNGRFVVANAGHLPPCVDGMEMVTDVALPLGLAGGQEYAQVGGYLPKGKRLVLLSDGVVEARSPKGELLGFARAAGLTARSAGEIAEEAQRFGQADDITVVSIGCSA